MRTGQDIQACSKTTKTIFSYKGKTITPTQLRQPAYNVLTNWKQDPHKVLHGSANNGVPFSNVAT
jgi:hypothetical protein